LSCCDKDEDEEEEGKGGGEEEESLSALVPHFEMLCWRRMEKISRTDRVRNEEVLLRVKEERNILHTVKIRKANWIGHILRGNCVLEHKLKKRVKNGYK
jgi:hypothetical protein